jgi:hypothetical protein
MRHILGSLNVTLSLFSDSSYSSTALSSALSPRPCPCPLTHLIPSRHLVPHFSVVPRVGKRFKKLQISQNYVNCVVQHENINTATYKIIYCNINNLCSATFKKYVLEHLNQ